MNGRPARTSEQRLHEAVESLYRTFRAPVPPAIEGCPCCIDTRRVDVLLSTPLRRLSGQDLWRYVSGLFLTVGSERDFRYLLPRIFEVAVIDPGNSNDPEIVLGKLKLAEWRSWPDDEQRAIEAFVDAWFERALVGDTRDWDDGMIGWDTESVLCGAARAGMPLDCWLIRLTEADAAQVLADLQERYPKNLSAFWEEAPSGFRELSTILTQGTT